MVRSSSPSHRRAVRPGPTRFVSTARGASVSAVLAVVAVVTLALAAPVIAAACTGDDPTPDWWNRADVQLDAPTSVAPLTPFDATVALHSDRDLPEGVVVLRVDGRRAARATVSGGSTSEAVTVTVPALPAGSHDLSALFVASGHLAGRSPTATVVSGDDASPGPSASPSDPPTVAPSSSPADPPSPTASDTPSSTPSETSTQTPSKTPTASASPSETPEPTPSQSPSSSPSPTTSPTSTPSAPPAGSCAAVPSSCGYPDGTNTGPARGTTFTAVPDQLVSGPGWSWNPTYQSVFVSGSGAVLDGLDIDGAVVIDAPDVVLRNSRISACGGDSDSDVIAIRYKSGDDSYRGSGARIVDNEIDGTPVGCDHRSRSGVRDVFGAAPDVLVSGNNIHGAGNGVTVEYQGLVTDNWVHALGHLAGDHHSGISDHGGAAQVTIRHNTVLLHDQVFAGGGGVSGAITVYSDFGHAQNTTIEDNLVSGGSYVIYGGNSGDDFLTPATGIKIRDNRFVCGDWLYGPVAAFDLGGLGNEWSGNVCDGTGTPVGW